MSADAAIRRTIQAQVEAWNDGDLDGFVQHVGPDVVYVTPSGILRGREALYEAYRGDWRDSPGGMLTADVEEIVDQARAAGLLLRETNEMPANNMLLVFERSG